MSPDAAARELAQDQGAAHGAARHRRLRAGQGLARAARLRCMLAWRRGDGSSTPATSARGLERRDDRRPPAAARGGRASQSRPSPACPTTAAARRALVVEPELVVRGPLHGGHRAPGCCASRSSWGCGRTRAARSADRPPHRRAARGGAAAAAERSRAAACASRGSRNLDKVFWPDEGYTKGDLLAYYEAVWPWLGALPARPPGRADALPRRHRRARASSRRTRPTSRPTGCRR